MGNFVHFLFTQALYFCLDWFWMIVIVIAFWNFFKWCFSKILGYRRSFSIQSLKRRNEMSKILLWAEGSRENGKIWVAKGKQDGMRRLRWNKPECVEITSNRRFVRDAACASAPTHSSAFDVNFRFSSKTTKTNNTANYLDKFGHWCVLAVLRPLKLKGNEIEVAQFS